LTELGTSLPLAGVRVIDFGCYIAGPLTGMLLADQGADVIKIDPAGRPLFDHAANAVLNRGKRCLKRNLKDPVQRGEIVGLIANADIVIENFGPGVAERLLLSSDRLRTLNPDLITVSLPGFPSGDDLVGDAKAFEGIIAAATAQYTNIHAARELFGLDPVYTALPLASVYAAVHAATAIVFALRKRDAGGGGTEIFAPLANAAMSAMTSLHLSIERQPERYAAPRLPNVVKNIILPPVRAWSAVGGAKAQAKFLDIARKSYPALMDSYVCADDRLLYLFAIDNAKLTRALLSGLGILDDVLALGLTFADPYRTGDRGDNLSETSNLSRAAQRKLRGLIADRLKTRTAAEWEVELAGLGVTCAMQRTTAEWLHVPEIAASGIVVELGDPEYGAMRQPGVQIWLSGSPAGAVRPQPRRTEADAATIDWQARSPIGYAESKTVPAAWLAGLTVIDMTSMVAGPVAARTLAEYGARVIKVEPPRPNHGPRLTCWYGVDGNAGKESVLLDVKTPDGREAMHRLLLRADVLITNHAPAAMAALGLDEAGVRAIKPDLVYCRIGAFNGPAGEPWGERHGYDPVLQAASGIMTRYGDPGHPELHAIASCVDALTGYSAAFGIALALHRRAQDGKGRGVDASLAAAATLVQLPYAFDHAGMTRAEPNGQTAKGEYAFYRLYRARDGWIFLAAPHATVTQLPPGLQPAGPMPDGDLAAHLEKIFRRQKVKPLIAMLASSGLPAARVRSVADLRPILTGRTGNGLRLQRADVAGLGPVVTAPAQQIEAGGQLKRLDPAEQPGSSTELKLKELGLDAAAMIASGAASCAFASAYLPE
jgi:crotonobetainyl-CoA:carnitine CoA-transferase CaiB-like acyl-CoA transferase